MDPAVLPSLTPSVSFVPSSKPSDVPTVSVDPSSDPSLSSSVPTVSTVPSSGPSLSPSTEPSVYPRVSIILPETTDSLVHGICVGNASYASANSSSSNLIYTAIDPFTGTVKAWDNRDYVIKGQENTPCDNGIFLRPSDVDGTPLETSITVTDFKKYRNGGFPSSLPVLGFADYGAPSEFVVGGAHNFPDTYGTLRIANDEHENEERSRVLSSTAQAQANELLLNENVEFKRGLADRIKIGWWGNKRRKRRSRSRNRKEKDSPTTDIDPAEEEDLVVNTGPKTYFDLERGGRLEKYRLRKKDRKFK
eukprot:scaffold60528_cov37-Attheya_sp.AAC.1